MKGVKKSFHLLLDDMNLTNECSGPGCNLRYLAVGSPSYFSLRDLLMKQLTSF